MTRTLSVLLLAAALACPVMLTLVPSTASAQSSKHELAGRLHKRALKAAKSGRADEASNLWEEAEALHPIWKYAFNLGYLGSRNAKWMDSWTALRRARGYGVPADKRQFHETTEAGVRAELLKKHAFIELSIEPDIATVTVGGKTWKAPYEGWMAGGRSEVVVSAPRHETARRTIEHSAGAVYRETFRLRAIVSTGDLQVRGGPKGALVELGKKPLGRLPSVNMPGLKPGKYTLKVTAPGHTGVTRSIRIKAGQTRSENINLVAAATTPIKQPLGTPANGLAPWGWASLGTGIALAGGGGALIVVAQGIAKDASGKSKAEQDELKGDFETVYPTGIALLAVGGALAVTGIVVLVLDEPGDESDTSLRFAPLVSRDQLGLTGQLRF